MKTILFYWSRGSETRVRMVRLIGKSEKSRKPCYINTLAKSLGLSHVAIKKHLDLLIDEGYVKILNPGGKPKFLALSGEGKKVAIEFSQ